MDPRLKSSKQWSPFPVELCDQICEVFTERFADEYDLRGFHFVTEGRIYPEEVIVRVGLTSNGQLKQHNFELSLTYNSESDKALEMIQKSVDLLEPSFVDLLEEEFADDEFDRKWQPIKNTKKLEAFLRYSTVNTNLEEQADRLLEEFDKKLYYGEDLPDPVEDEPTLH